MSRYSIDFGFIASLEGGPFTRGYVPAAGSSKSGVTIGTGFDLGQRTIGDLRQLQLPADLVALLSPYLGLIRGAAVKALQDQALVVTPAQAELIDEAYRAPFVASLASQYVKASKGLDFATLWPARQTVIASVAFQYGDLKSRTPEFWGRVVVQDWLGAENILRNFHDAYPTRRCKEANLLAGAKPPVQPGPPPAGPSVAGSPATRVSGKDGSAQG